MTEQVLNDMKRMLDLGTYAGLNLFQPLFGLAQRVLLERLAYTPFERNMPSDGRFQVLGALLNTLIASVTKGKLFSAVQQRMRLGYVRHVTRRGDQCVCQAGDGVDANMSFHPEVPGLALL